MDSPHPHDKATSTRNTILVADYLENSWKERRVTCAPCPCLGSPSKYPHEMHELCVADCFPDDLNHMFCTCGWVGTGHATEELAVDEFNREAGVVTEVVSRTITHLNIEREDSVDELPF